jgi:hypothetical protein
MKEFVWYHVCGDVEEGEILHVYAHDKGLTQQDMFDLVYFYALSYCCATAIFLYENRARILSDTKPFADEYKTKLIFQSDRRYVRMLDNFYKMLLTWIEKIHNKEQQFKSRFVDGNTVDIKRLLQECEKWYFFSRCSSYLFAETYCDMFEYGAKNDFGIDYGGDRMTFVEGVYRCFGMDEEAEYIMKYHKLPTDMYTFESLLSEVCKEVRAFGGDSNVTKMESSLCAYAKFFHGTRYNGYYADRQLQEIRKMGQTNEFTSACQAVLEARKKVIKKQYRGEDNGWDGVRSEKKKHYLETGKIEYCPVYR